jgi:hypothetical protein
MVTSNFFFIFWIKKVGKFWNFFGLCFEFVLFCYFLGENSSNFLHHIIGKKKKKKKKETLLEPGDY